jgi:hypothetical protein
MNDVRREKYQVMPASPTLDPRAWSLSTPQEREAFVTIVGPREIECVINAVEPSHAPQWWL